MGILYRPADVQNGLPKKEMMAARQNGKASDTGWHVRADGKEIWCSGVLIHVPDDNADGFANFVF